MLLVKVTSKTIMHDATCRLFSMCRLKVCVRPWNNMSMMRCLFKYLTLTPILPVYFASHCIGLLQCSHHCGCVTSWQSASHLLEIFRQGRSLCPRVASPGRGHILRLLAPGEKYHSEEYPIPAVSCHSLLVTAVFYVITWHTAVCVDLAKCEPKSCVHEYNYVVKA